MIGIFDSGTGGLSVFREIRKLLPEENYVYYSDNAHCPYGEKSQDYIIDRARFITEFLLGKGARIIVVACNTATAAAIATLRNEYPDTPFIGMEPAIKPAVGKTSTGVVGVLATAGTLKADKYLNTRERWAEGVRIAEHTGQGFVELVEAGNITGPQAEAVVEASLKPIIDEGADVIVLGCTHYPFLSGTISKVSRELYPDRVITIIDPAPAVARHVLDTMKKNNILSEAGHGFSMELHASGDDTNLKKFYKTLV